MYQKCRLTLMGILSLVLLFATAFQVLGADNTSISRWHTTSEDQRSQQREEYVNRSETEGLRILYDEIYQNIGQLPEATSGSSAEQEWIHKFLRVMDSARVEKPLGQAPQAVLDDASIQVPAPEVANQIKADFRDHFSKNPFEAEQSQFDGQFYIFENHPTDEITFSPEETSPVAKTLWTEAEILKSLFNNANIPYMKATHQAILTGKNRWNNFQDHALADQFPWETLGNGWLGAWVPGLEGTLSMPPTWQLRVVHPTPVAAVTLEGDTTFKPRMAVEAIGYRSFKPDRFEPRWGLSALAALPGSSDENVGWGGLLTFKNASVGVVWQDADDREDVVTVVVGLDLAQFIEDKGQSLRDKVDQVKGKLDEVGELLHSF